ncbi:MAG: transcription termination factor Rho [Eubacteriales bacterium]|nr:transcription termination factor Rho [Eubacteriales bacterium]
METQETKEKEIQAADEAEEKKPVRRTRKTATKTSAGAAKKTTARRSAAKAKAKVVEEETKEAESETEEKKPVRRTRKTASKTEEAGEEKPKARRTTRKKAEAEDKTEEKAEPKKTVRRARTRKTAAEKEAEEQAKEKTQKTMPETVENEGEHRTSAAALEPADAAVDSQGAAMENADAEKTAYEEQPADDRGFAGSADNEDLGNQGEAEGEPTEGEEDEESQRHEGEHQERPEVTGILEIADGGFGFLRFENFLTSDKDIYVSATQIRRFNLKTGDEINGISRLPNRGERFGALLYVNTVNGEAPGMAIHRKPFESLTPIYPHEKLTLENSREELATRLIDLIAPIGKGQRGIIAAPPKAGKTTLLKMIANAVEESHPEAEMIVLLIDERPEEVTDMKRSLKRGGEVIYSTFDEQPAHHVKVAEMVLARAKRLAEAKKDVIILLDSLTRMTRAYNLVVPPSGRTLSGGLDPGAFYGPKRFFGAARNIEEGGSITILATALIDTGSRMDEVIFEEFKGTGNMELYLDRKLSERRIFPAIDINKSGTRKEELLMSPEELQAMRSMRRALVNKPPQEVTETVVENLARTKTNADFIEVINKIFK